MSDGLEGSYAEYADISLEMSQTFEPSSIVYTLEEVAEEFGIDLDELRGEA